MVADQSSIEQSSGLDEGALPIRMLHDRVLVSTDNEPGERRSSGGILIPATVAIGRRLAWGQVVAVGTNVRTVKPTDRVLFDPEDEPRLRSEARITCYCGSGIFMRSLPRGCRTAKLACICELPLSPTEVLG